jgi:hypothetical protein
MSCPGGAYYWPKIPSSKTIKGAMLSKCERYVAWLGRLIPGRFGTIEQDDIGRAFVAEFIESSAPNGTVYFENEAMRQVRMR